ncbi:MAG: hypothetical protein F4X57_10210 [Chloroflexi bacterium]|nr:hypothetical protein [Chloroflexota bacterium]
MIEREMTDLEEEQNWDFEDPVKSEPVRNRRTVVSVSFPSSALQVVAAAANKAGLSTSRFIRDAAIAKASPVYTEVVASWGGSTAPVVFRLDPSSSTLGQATEEPLIESPDNEAHIYLPA